MSKYKYWFPEYGETENDAKDIPLNVSDHEEAANLACEYDWYKHNGWERFSDYNKTDNVTFDIAVYGFDQTEQMNKTILFTGKHEKTIEHSVSPQTINS